MLPRKALWNSSCTICLAFIRVLCHLLYVVGAEFDDQSGPFKTKDRGETSEDSCASQTGRIRNVFAMSSSFWVKSSHNTPCNNFSLRDRVVKTVCSVHTLKTLVSKSRRALWIIYRGLFYTRRQESTISCLLGRTLGCLLRRPKRRTSFY